MPYNVTTGNTVQFDWLFLDSTGAITVPSSATMTITYTDLSGATAQSCSALSLSGSVFTGTWGSSVASLGSATASAIAAGQATATTVDLRIIQE